MREIKFRGRFNPVDWMFSKSILWFKSKPYFFSELTGNSIGIDPKTLGQYTGLKDIHGYEIYENDIVKWGHLEGSKEDPVRIAKVVLNPDIQYVCLKDLMDCDYRGQFCFNHGCFSYYETHKYLEIIGNIHEIQKPYEKHNR